ncbi:MAG TPA: hypothetical protein VMB50_18920 [Myxococcales bacterium]|nr:hypothetical protein [Myxococcales bacterium]
MRIESTRPPSALRIGLLLLAVAAATRQASAQETPSARLTYERGPGAERCPSETALREAVSARLGYDPFRSGAPTAIAVSLRRAQEGLSALVVLRGPTGVLGRRAISSRASDCTELASALELAVCIAIDPLVLTRARPAPPPPPPAPAPAPAVKTVVIRTPPAVAKPAPERKARRSNLWPREWLLSASVAGSLDSAPAPALGPTVQVEARWPLLSLALEGRADAPATGPALVGQLQTSLLMVTLVPCYRLGIFGACALVSAGVQEATSQGLPVTNHVVSPYAAVGARALAEIPLGRWLALEIAVDVRAPTQQTTYTVNGKVDGQTDWVTPPVSGSLALGLAFRLP